MTFFHSGRHIFRIRLPTVDHHHGDLSAEVLLIETKGLFSVAAVVEVGV
jgi:hypothetical protein